MHMCPAITVRSSKPMLTSCSNVARSQGVRRLVGRVMPAVRAYADASGAAAAGGRAGDFAGAGAGAGNIPMPARGGGDRGDAGSQVSRRDRGGSRGGQDAGSALARAGGGGGILGVPSIFDSLFRPFLSLTDDLSTPFGGGDVLPEGLRRLAVDVREEDDKYVIKADVPGTDVDNVRVWIDPDDGVLRIEAEREEERDRDEGGVRRVERVYGRFVRAFRLPQDASPEEITAQVKSGELDIVLPKKEEAEQDKSRRKRIPVKDRDAEKTDKA